MSQPPLPNDQKDRREIDPEDLYEVGRPAPWWAGCLGIWAVVMFVATCVALSVWVDSPGFDQIGRAIVGYLCR